MSESYTFYVRFGGQVLQQTVEFETEAQAIRWGRQWREAVRAGLELDVTKQEPIVKGERQ